MTISLPLCAASRLIQILGIPGGVFGTDLKIRWAQLKIFTVGVSHLSKFRLDIQVAPPNNLLTNLTSKKWVTNFGDMTVRKTNLHKN